MRFTGKAIRAWCPYVEVKLSKAVEGDEEVREAFPDGESGRDRDQGPGSGGSMRVKKLAGKSRGVWICVLGLVFLVLGYWLFYYGSRLKYLPKYHTIVLVSGANGTIMSIAAWLSVAGVCAMGMGAMVEIIRRFRGKHRKRRNMSANAALMICLAYLLYVVTLALLTLTQSSPWPLLWFFIGTPVTVYLALIHAGINWLC